MLRVFNVIWVGLMIAGAVFTYVMKDRAGQAADHVHQLRDEIAHEKDSLTVLRAEWSVLDQPARLQSLVTRYSSYLDLVPIDVRQFVTVEQIPMKPPQPSLDGMITSSTSKAGAPAVQAVNPSAMPGDGIGALTAAAGVKP